MGCPERDISSLCVTALAPIFKRKNLTARVPAALAPIFEEKKTSLRGCLQPSPLCLWRKKRPCGPLFFWKRGASVHIKTQMCHPKPYIFVYDWRRRGSAWAHTSGKRSHRLQEVFRWRRHLWEAIQQKNENAYKSPAIEK